MTVGGHSPVVATRPDGILQALPAGAPRWTAWRMLAAATAVMAAVGLGTLLPVTGPIFIATIALGIAGIAVLGALALQRFEWFIWTILLVRPALDLTKGEPGGGSGLLATLVGGALIVVGAVWVAALSRDGRRLPLGIISRSLLLLVFTSIPSVLASRQPVESAMQVARLLGAVMLFVALEQLIRSRRTALRTMVVCALATGVPLLAGLVQLLTGSGRDANGLIRLTGSFTHPNSFGFFLALVLLMGYALRKHVHGHVRRALNAMLIIAAVELLFTFSRGSWIALLLGLVVVGLLADRRIFVAVPAIAGAVWFLVPAVRSRLADLAAEDTVGGRPGNSATWRIAHIKELLEGAQGQTLFGIGPGMTRELTKGGRDPHNDVVRVFIEYGVIGLVFYLGFLIGLVVLTVRALRSLRDGLGRGLAVGFAAVTTAFIVDSMGANLITQFVLLVYVLALAAVVQAWITFPDPAGAPPASPD